MLQLLRKITVGQEQIIEKFYRCLNCVVLAGEHGQREELTAMQNTKQGEGGGGGGGVGGLLLEVLPVCWVAAYELIF